MFTKSVELIYSTFHCPSILYYLLNKLTKEWAESDVIQTCVIKLGTRLTIWDENKNGEQIWWNDWKKRMSVLILEASSMIHYV